ncbi:MAG TPA: glycosyltransferase, partial [Blastocatellia bacterium]|nr:glycosyltransferase [Blastocatellia bacterium]
MSKRKVCLISPGHIASNPRLVKEADALHEAGFQVRVIASDYMEVIRSQDETIYSKATWAFKRVGLGSPLGYAGRTLRQRSARLLAAAGYIPSLSAAAWAHSRMTGRLAAAAAAESADLYIAHYLAAFPAAAAAARRHGARLGFDAEDFHVGEVPDVSENRAEIALRDCIEAALLPRCRHLTAASPGIAEAYADRYGVSMETVLNVFPLSDAPASCERQDGDRVGAAPSLYWFSQTLGPGRGLEFVVRAMGRMRTTVSLHLRGLPAAGYVETLNRLAGETGVAGRVHLLPIATPSEMARLAACHDVGLALELDQPPHRAVCLTNKIFVYLLAGLPLLLSDTPAQREMV